jgi:hypothetical protein
MWERDEDFLRGVIQEGNKRRGSEGNLRAFRLARSRDVFHGPMNPPKTSRAMLAGSHWIPYIKQSSTVARRLSVPEDRERQVLVYQEGRKRDCLVFLYE